MVSLLIVGESLWVCLGLPGIVEKFFHQWLMFALDDFVVLAESSVVMMYQVNLDLLSTNLLMHIEVRLIFVIPLSSCHFQFDH